MPMTVLHLTDETRDLAEDLARMTGMSVEKTIERALKQFRRHLPTVSLVDGYAAWNEDETPWSEAQAETEAWRAALRDLRRETARSA